VTEATNTEPLRQELERQAQAPATKTVRELIDRMKPELEKSLQSKEAAAILTRHYFTAVRYNVKLLECSGESLLGALLLSAQVRLEPGPLGHVYLIPFKGECVWMLGYTGITELARRSERVGGIEAILVWNNDEYDYWRDEKGAHFKYRPGNIEHRTDRRLVCVTWKERVGTTWIPRVHETLPPRIARAQKASPAFRNHQGPWITDEDKMWLKTGIRDVRSQLPLSPDLVYASQSDDELIHGIVTDEQGAAQPALDMAQVSEDDVVPVGGDDG